VFAHVSVKHTVYDQLPHVSLCFDWNVFEEISIITIEHNLKSSCQVVLFENKGVTVSDSKRVLGANDELIGVAWMLIVVDQVSDKAGKNIIELKVTLKVG
jgi:hypothetical protein